jgi:hypothetical protein
VARLAEQLIGLFRDTQTSLSARLAEATSDPSRAQLRRLQATVDETLSALNADAAAWLEGNMTSIYELGGTHGAVSVGDSFTWSQFHVDAVQVLAQQTYSEVLEATGFVRSETKAWIRQQARTQTTAALLEGRTAQGAGRDLARSARELGDSLTSIVYKNGARHTIADYGNVLLRTTSANCYNAGTLNMLSTSGIEYVEVLDGDCGWSSHDDPDRANGTVRSVSDAMEHSLSHPRCVRSFVGRVDVRSAQQAASAKSLRSAESIADQAQVSVQRAEAVQRRAARKARTERSARTARTARAASSPT